MQMVGSILVVKDEVGRCFHVDLQARTFQTLHTARWEVRQLTGQKRWAEACDCLLRSPDTGYPLQNQLGIFQLAERPEAATLAAMVLAWSPPPMLEASYVSAAGSSSPALELPHNGWASNKLRGLSESALSHLRHQMQLIFKAIDLDEGDLRPGGLDALGEVLKLLTDMEENPTLQTAAANGQHIWDCIQSPQSYQEPISASVARLAIWLSSLSQLVPAP